MRRGFLFPLKAKFQTSFKRLDSTEVLWVPTELVRSCPKGWY